MWVVIGLGNPGSAYAAHRHNVGFQVLDHLTRAYGFPPFQEKGKRALTEGVIGGGRVMALKPLAFMNLSGPPASDVVHFYKVPLTQVLVIHDDLDVPFGKIKFKTGGGAGGHNGLKSLDSCLGPGYQRLRIGIGHPGDRDLVTPYVLGNFMNAEKEALGGLMTKISEHISLIFQNDIPLFLTKMCS